MRGLIALPLLVGCFHPDPLPGAPCPDDICPSGLVCSPATKTCELSAVPADAETDAPDSAPEPAVRYRRRIVLVNVATVPLPAGYTVRVPLDTAALTGMVGERKAKQDLSNVHVIGDGDIGEIDRIADSGAGFAPPAVSFALKAPIAAGALNTDYSLVYGGDSAAPALAKGSAVFPLYEDFSTAVSPKWLQNDAPTIVNGKLVLRAGHTDALTMPAATDNLPPISSLEIIAKIVDVNSNPTDQNGEPFYYWFGFQRTGDFTPSDPWALWVARGKAQIRAEQKSPVGCETPCEGPTVTQTSFAHYYTIERDPTVTRFYLDGVLSYTATVNNTTDYAIMVRNFMQTSDVQISWIRARARVSPDPKVSVDKETTF
jgi:hypothetical protein